MLLEGCCATHMHTESMSSAHVRLLIAQVALVIINSAHRTTTSFASSNDQKDEDLQGLHP
jgi:hypothetical protein